MDETLLFLHVLSAFLLASTVVMMSAVALGAPVGARVASLGNLLWDIGGLGTLAFGIWIVAREETYEITEGWLIAAIVLWFLASGAAMVTRRGLNEDDPEHPRYTAAAARMHWVRSLIVVVFLVLMVWKPGA
jgi:uncharacterized membrane protein